MAVPTIAIGTAVGGGSADITPTLPAHQADDWLYVDVETADEAVTCSTSGWNEALDSPQSVAAGAGSIRITTFCKLATSSSETDPTIQGAANHKYAVPYRVRGAKTTGEGVNVTAGGTESTSDTSLSMGGDTTTVAECLIVNSCARSSDFATAQFSGEADSSLTNLTELHDAGTATGNGGGIGIWSGEKATAGAYGPMTATLANAGTKAFISRAFEPLASVTAIGKEVQFLWDIRAAIGDTITLRWDIAFALGDTSQFVWDVRTSVGDQFQALWDIRAAVGDQTQFLWDLAFALGDDNQLVWDVHAAVNDTVSFLWDQHTVIGDQVQLLWDQFTSLGEAIDLRWDLRAAVGDQIALLWDLAFALGENNQLVWDVSATVNDQVQFLWDQFTIVDDQVQLLWDIHTIIGEAIEFLWDIAFALGDVADLRWDVRANVSDTINFLWDVLPVLVFQVPGSVVSNVGWDTGPTPGGDLAAAASSADSDYVTVTV